jgi:peroxiredoxin Q/BCP
MSNVTITSTVESGLINAPEFALPDQNMKIASLNDYRGKWVVLFFYPMDNTPGCTMEAKEFTATTRKFSELNAVVLGISPDSAFSHCQFIEDYGLKLKLLSDINGVVAKKYGAWGARISKGIPAGEGLIRSTFLISPDGEVAKSWKNVTPAGHAQEVLNALRNLNSGG